MVSLEDVLKTSWRCLEDVSKTSWRCLEDIWPRRKYWSWPRRLEDVFKTSSEDVRLGEHIRLDQDVLKTSWRRLLKTKTKNVFKMSSRRLHQDECLLGSDKDIFLKLMFNIQKNYMNFVVIYRFYQKEKDLKSWKACN